MLALREYKKEDLNVKAVTNANFDRVVTALAKNRRPMGIDFETYGLDAFDGMFSMALALGDEKNTCFYFSWSENTPEKVKLAEELKKKCAVLFSNKTKLVAHNFIFELKHAVYSFGVNTYRIKTQNICTLETEKHIAKGKVKKTLDACVERYGLGRKDDTVMNYIKEHKLYDDIDSKGRLIKPRFDEVPYKMTSLYCALDAHLCLALHYAQRESIKHVF